MIRSLNTLHEVMELSMLTPDWHCISEPKDLFALVRTEDIAALDNEFPVKRIKLVATDGATNYKKSDKWSSGYYPEKLVIAMQNFKTVFSAWDGSKLIGMICAMDDGVMNAYVHYYLLVDPVYL